MKSNILRGIALAVCCAVCVTSMPVAALAADRDQEELAVAESQDGSIQAVLTDISEEMSYMPGEVLAAFNQSMGEAQIRASIEELGGECSRLLPMGDGVMATVELPDSQTVEEAVEMYGEYEGITFVQPNYCYTRRKKPEQKQPEQKQVQRENRSSQPSARTASATNDTYVSEQWYLNKIHTFEAWDILDRRSTSKVRVAVLDSGCDTKHPDLQANLNKSLCVNVNGGEIIQRPTDSLYNGTGMCGVIGATSNNGTGITGVAAGRKNNILDMFSVQVWKTYDLGFTSFFWVTSEDFCAGITYAIEKGAKVINMSDWITYVDEAFQTKCKEAYDKNITLVCSVGVPSSDDNQVCYPAAFDTTIGVAACSDFTDSQKEDGGESNYGEHVDICAPGEGIVTTNPLDEPLSDYGEAYLGVGYDKWEYSVDMASASATGVAAMLYAANPSITPSQVKTALKNTATDLYLPGEDEYTGAGLINAEKALQYVLPKPTGIQLSAASLQLGIGETRKITAVLQPANAEGAVAYTSSNPGVASVDAAGNVRGVAQGTAVITVSSQGVSAVCTVTVGCPITYVLGGGKNHKDNPAYYTGKAVKLKSPARKGYAFMGWYTNAAKTKKITSITKSASGYTLYAKWKKIAKPQKAVIKAAVRISNKKMKISLKKVSGADGYQIVYAADKKIKKNKKTIFIKGTSKTIKSLKKSRYFVKVRAYKLDSAKNKIYGKYSAVKKV
ncbi:MAG: S8 family serine peptidase [Lachnospiraceae bacterium]|nr:S8 family serine peptidase [Lachnospiraceae bacterium]